MNTDWEQRRGIEERGTLTSEELQDLIGDADSCEIAEALMDGLKKALAVQLGYLVVDVSTDEGYALNLVRVEDADAEESVVI